MLILKGFVLSAFADYTLLSFVILHVIHVKSMANSHTTYTLLYYIVTFFENAISFVAQYILKYVTRQEKFKKRHTLEHSVILNYNS